MLQFISNIHNKLKGFRTVLIGSSFTILSVVVEFGDEIKNAGLDLTSLVPDNVTFFGHKFTAASLCAIISAIMVFMRFITKGKVGDNQAYVQPAVATANNTGT